MKWNDSVQAPRHCRLAMTLAALAFTSCATLQLPDYPQRAVQEQPTSAVQGGLAVGAHPIIDEHESEKYFGVDLLAADVLAVAVTVENRSADSSFVFEKKRCRLGNLTEGVDSFPDLSESETTATALGIASVALISPLLIPVSAKMGSDARIIKHNFVTKELRATTVNSGQAVQGFLYFQLPNQAASNNDYVLHLEALELKTRQYKSLDIPLHTERN